MKHITLLAALLFFPIHDTLAEKKESHCWYQDEVGTIRAVTSLNEVPPALRAEAKCGKGGINYQELAPPEDIELKGNIRYENSNTPLGVVHLRWPRKVEALFGRTPRRALADAAKAVNSALRRSGFPTKLTSLNLQWKVVFLDENLPETQIPMALISGCHPGWMTPPANIYIVAQRIAAGCGGGPPMRASEADAQLAEVVIHEMGHAIEYQLLGPLFAGDRPRAEGFATWFESYASEFAEVIPNGKVKAMTTELARRSFAANPGQWIFQGSAEDYARASMYFAAIVDRRGVSGLMSVYKNMAEKKQDLFTAVKERLGWNTAQYHREIERILTK